MTLRRKSREYALQMLFQWEMGKQEPSRIEDGFWKNARAQKSTREFANQLFENAVARAECSCDLPHRTELNHCTRQRLDCCGFFLAGA